MTASPYRIVASTQSLVGSSTWSTCCQATAGVKAYYLLVNQCQREGCLTMLTRLAATKTKQVNTSTRQDHMHNLLSHPLSLPKPCYTDAPIYSCHPWIQRETHPSDSSLASQWSTLGILHTLWLLMAHQTRAETKRDNAFQFNHASIGILPSPSQKTPHQRHSKA